MKPILLRMAGRDEVRVKPVFVRDGKPIPVWELVKLAPSGPDIPKAKGRGGTAKSGSRSEAAKKAWETIRRKRGIRAGHELA